MLKMYLEDDMQNIGKRDPLRDLIVESFNNYGNICMKLLEIKLINVKY